ncbi:DUF167 domain-containing protein [bacterium]|nr:DUF167 domain-containing protein [bacterium]
MIEIHPQKDGLTFALKARPGARRSSIDGVHAGALKVSVTAAPEKGKANEAIIELLADELNISRSSITIVRGETSSQKVVRIDGVNEVTLKSELERIISRITKQGKN